MDVELDGHRLADAGSNGVWDISIGFHLELTTYSGVGDDYELRMAIDDIELVGK